MTEPEIQNDADEQESVDEASQTGLESGTYEVIRNRLSKGATSLRGRLDKLNHARKEVFGAIETVLIATERMQTKNNCIARDMVPIGNCFIFGYNVHVGLRSSMTPQDVFSIYAYKEKMLVEQSFDLLADENFERDFLELFKYYKNTVFAKFSIIGPHLYMAFKVGKSDSDIKTFKWHIDGDKLTYMDSRSEHEFRFPPQHDFEWTRTHRDMHYSGVYPHVSIEDRLFVETVGGDLTIKVDNNTDTGEGIYSEPVQEKDQTLDDAEYFYAIVGNLILLKILPYQENQFRYFVYSEKTRKAYRMDGIAESCVLLPDSQGIIFSSGYFLQTGEHKTFDSAASHLQFTKRIASENGEDYLYVFYNRVSGLYVLLSYNVIEQRLDTPVVCNGYSLFPNGEMIYFKDSAEPQRNHAVQIWQTPFVAEDHATHEQSDSFLYKIGNKEIVRGMSDCNEILNLVSKEDSYENLFVDLTRRTTDTLDTYHWIGDDQAFNLREELLKIKEAAEAAVSEFDKVVSVRRNTAEQLRSVEAETNTVHTEIGARRFEDIHDFVSSLLDLRSLRGKIISLNDLKYIDTPTVERLEEKVKASVEKVSEECVAFLLNPDSLAPYDTAIEEQHAQIDGLTKVVEAKELEEKFSADAAELEMLIEVVSNLHIDDATQRTTIIDDISTIFGKVNRSRSELRNKSQSLAKTEGIAEFNSELKLLNQAVENYLDVSDSPEKCEVYLTKVMVKIEELDGRFAEFDEFLMQLTEKREEIYNAFEAKKLQLLEKRNKRVTALAAAADRILSGIKARVEGLKTINEINGYFASDLMIDKVRDIVDQLDTLGDSVKVDDIQSRLKTISEDAVRQLKDRLDLYEDGDNIIKMGEHKFSVNNLALNLTTIRREGEMYFHLAGTNYFELIDDPDFLATRDAWDQDVVSENGEVYRGEFLAYQIMKSVGTEEVPEITALLEMDEETLTSFVQGFMGSRYTEAYTKGVHDHDTAIILRALLTLSTTIGLLAYAPQARALAAVFWNQYDDSENKTLLKDKLLGFGLVREAFPETEQQALYIHELGTLISNYVESTSSFDTDFCEEAADYLFEELTRGEDFVISKRAAELYNAFNKHIDKKYSRQKYEESLSKLVSSPNSTFLIYRDWVDAFLENRDDPAEKDYRDEVASLLLSDKFSSTRVIDASSVQELTGLVGAHDVIEEKTYLLNYNAFMTKLDRFHKVVVPRYEDYQRIKKELVDEEREALKLEEFMPRVLTSFVRNKLIDNVYLHLIGDNFAKQIGSAGEQKRTDRMGLLLLISPPGYGKTTLMEYVANRLGIIFMKINGPALGHQVTSLDPAEAPNAAAREEIMKLNLALEMGDNVMIYLDDIQHCNAELLQKFISLCDATRKIEGVHKGKSKTYDLRGKKVAVIMAGNPYTESGEKFQIPDMLANRADTYNLGEIIGGSATDFEMSYLENSMTSNPVLNKLASKSQNDVYEIIRMAESGSNDIIDLEGSYSLEETNEMVEVMKKMIRVRDVILRVNEEYIRSAGIGAEYRTEPAFKLQGSYRNMNRIAERIVGIMNDQELETLVLSNYENDSQTLTTGAESNMLKFRELINKQTPDELERWEGIKRTFSRNLKRKGLGDDEAVGQVLLQLEGVSDGLDSIRKTMTDGVRKMGGVDETPQEIHVVSKVPQAIIGVMSEQFKLMEGWLAPVLRETSTQSKELTELRKLLDKNMEQYEILLDELHEDKAEGEKD
jgi:hypothetical protein